MKLPTTKRRESANTTSISPFTQTISSLQDAMNRMFDDAWFNLPAHGYNSLTDDSRSNEVWWPRTDITETDKSIKIKMDIPGVDPKDITIEADRDTLVVNGTTTKEEKEKNENYIRIERQSGAFNRIFNLPGGLDIDNIKATNKNGTLSLYIPKKPEAQKKKISVDIQT